MIERWAKRGPEPLPFTDIPDIPLPIITPCPEEILLVCRIDKPYYLDEDYTAIHRSDFPTKIKSEATPKQLVAAIEAADRYAEMAERLANEYRKLVQNTNEHHTSNQMEHIQRLYGLCATTE